MTKIVIGIALVVGVVIGSAGMYYANYALNIFGIEGFTVPSTIEPPPDEEITIFIPKSLVTNELQYTLLEVREIEFGINGEKPLEGGKFLVTKLQIENLGKNEVIVYGKNWSIKDDNGRVYHPRTFDANPEEGDNIFSIRIPAGFKLVKSIGFEIPSSLNSNRELYVPNKGYDSNPIFLDTI